MRNVRLFMTLAVVGWVAAPAPAFYWLGWPGANPTARPSIPSITDVVEHRPPTDPGTDPPTPDPPTDPEPPKGVPEPGTLGLAAAGLAVVAVRWWKRRRVSRAA